MEDASPARSAISSGILLGFALGLFWSGRSLALRHGPALESERSTVVSAQGNPGMDRAARVIHLPALGVQGEQERCSVEIDVQNLGDEASKLVLVVWGLPVACGPFEAGPYNTACSGLVAPGASWTFEPRQVPLGSYSGRLYSFNARRLSDIGAPVEDRFDDLAADYLCERIFVDTVGDEAEFLAFQRAFERGERFWDLPLDRVLGGEVLAGVQRICPGDLRPGLEVVSSYAGIGGNLLVGSAGIDGRYRQHLSAEIGRAHV